MERTVSKRRGLCYSVKRAKRTYKLTLIEVVIAMVLLGILLTSLFSSYRQTLKNNITLKTVKQTVQQIEVFHQRIRSLLLPPHNKKIWLQPHPDALGAGLMLSFEQPIDKDLDFCGELQGMLFFNAQHQLLFVTWGHNQQTRLETLLEDVESMQCEFFDADLGKWFKEWPHKKTEKPVMVKITLKYQKKELPFVYFLDSASTPIELHKETR